MDNSSAQTPSNGTPAGQAESEHTHQVDAQLPEKVDVRALEHAAEIFKALSTTSRLRILLTLTARSASVSEIVDETGLSQPLVSQHLKLLRGLHLVTVERVGREAIYSLADDHVSHVIIDALAHVEE